MGVVTALQLVKEAYAAVKEIAPWDYEDWIEEQSDVLVVDVREHWEFDEIRLADSICVPRGVIEPATEFGNLNTVPVLARRRDKPLILVCLGGERSGMAVQTLQTMGFNQIYHLKEGLRGLNDIEWEFVDGKGNPVDEDDADTHCWRKPSPEQMEDLEAK